MDFIELIILLIIFLAPAIGRLFEKMKPAPPPTEPRPESHEDDPLGEALRQIREALGEPAPEPAPPPKPVPAPPRLEQTHRASDLHGLGAAEHEGLVVQRRSPAESLERRPVVLVEPPRPAPPKRAALPSPPKPTAPAFSSRDFVHRLRDPRRAREAFILHEVFGPPRSRRR